MYKVCIIDDEAWIVESLRASVNWAEFGFEVAGHAYNGIDAYQMIRQIKPEVVFTDIRMPGINGLDLIKQVKGIPLNTIFIIVSGYAEFAYAQKAINAGAIGYCLKPFDDAEVAGLLKKCRQILDSSSNLFENTLVNLFENPSKQNQSEIYHQLEMAGLIWDGQDGMAVLVVLGAELDLPPELEHVKLRIGLRKQAYLFRNSKYPLVSDFLSEHKLNGIQGIGAAFPVLSAIDIKDAVERANIASYQGFIIGHSGLYEAIASNFTELSVHLRGLEEAIQKKDADCVIQAFQRIEDCFSKGSYTIDQAFHLYNRAMSYISKLEAGTYTEFISSYSQLLESFASIWDMLRYLKTLALEQIRVKPDHNVDNIENSIFKAIINYVNDHFCTEISINSLSQKYFINASYLCQLFRKELGMTFTEYISSLRIKYACRLLPRSELSIREIGERCGYSDYFYFSKVFKKATGKTPTQFREELQ